MDKQWILANKGKVIGTGIGLLLGIIFLIAGFWKMIFFALLTSVGFGIGYQLDQKPDVKDWIDTVLLDKWMRK